MVQRPSLRHNIEQASESRAGRIAFVDMGGFTLEEVGAKQMRRLWFRIDQTDNRIVNQRPVRMAPICAVASARLSIPPPLPHSSTAKSFARISAGKCICGAVEWANNSPQNPARAFPYRHTVRRASSNTPLCSGLPGMMRIHSGIPNDAQLRTAI